MVQVAKTGDRLRGAGRRRSPMRIAAVTVVALALTAGGAIYVRLRVLVDGLASAPSGPKDPTLLKAHQLGRTFQRVQPVEPFGLTTVLPDGWECHFSTGIKATRCGNGDWSVGWMIEVESSEVRTDSLIAWSHGDSNGNSPERDDHVEDLSLAGFRGFVRYASGSRRPYVTWSFRGWFDDAARGRLRLDAWASTGPNGTLEALDGLAIVLGTSSLRPAPYGPAESWPSDEERARRADMETGFYWLKGDDSSQWARSADELVRRLPKGRDGTPRGLLGEPLRSRTAPSVTDLLERRAAQLMGEGRDHEVLQVVISLTAWDPAAARPVLERAHGWLEKRLDEATTQEERELRLVNFATVTERRVHVGDRAGLSLFLGRVSSSRPFELPERVLMVLGELRGEREVLALLDRWFAAAPVIPADANHHAIAGLVVPSALDHLRLRRFVLAQLGNKTTDGKARICDHYASRLRHTNGAPKIDWDVSVIERDRGIGELAKWLRGLPVAPPPH